MCGKEIDANAGNCPYCGAQIIPDSPYDDSISELELPNYGQNSEPLGPAYQDVSQYRRVPQYHPVPVQSNNTMRKVALILGVAAALFCAVSVVLPFLTVSLFGASRSVTLLSGTDGAAVLALSILALIFVIAGRNGRGIVNIVMGLMLCGAALLDGVKNKSNLDKTGYAGLVNYGIGFYVLLFCSLLIVVSGIILIVANKKDSDVVSTMSPNGRGHYGI